MKHENGDAAVRAEPFGRLRTGPVEAWTAQRDSPFDRLRVNGTIPVFGRMERA